MVFLVFLDPIETGDFLLTLERNGPTASYNFGLYLGNRYKTFPNIVWASGNDYDAWVSDPMADPVVTAVAQGLRAADPNHIQTVELGYRTEPSDSST